MPNSLEKRGEGKLLKGQWEKTRRQLSQCYRDRLQRELGTDSMSQRMRRNHKIARGSLKPSRAVLERQGRGGRGGQKEVGGRLNCRLGEKFEPEQLSEPASQRSE